MNASSKAVFNISEAASLLGLPAHVLRFWEKEFPQLDPDKDRNGQRIYKQKDLDLALHIKKLLYEEEYTIKGARRRLEEDRREARSQNQMSLELNLRETELTGQLLRVKRQVKALLDLLDKGDSPEAGAVAPPDRGVERVSGSPEAEAEPELF